MAHEVLFGWNAVSLIAFFAIMKRRKNEKRRREELAIRMFEDSLDAPRRHVQIITRPYDWARD